MAPAAAVGQGGQGEAILTLKRWQRHGKKSGDGLHLMVHTDVRWDRQCVLRRVS